MRIHRWLMPLFVAVITATVASADEPGPKAGSTSPSAAIETNGGEPHRGEAAEPIQGSYQFLLEVAGVTPDQPSQKQDRSAGAPPRRDLRVVREAIDPTD
jgi:hypothetical protein